MPKYEKPYYGQVFKRIQNEDRFEYGACTGVATFGGEKWTAVIESGVVAQATRIYDGAEYAAETDWTPLTAKELSDLSGAAVLGDTVDKATFLALLDRVAALEREHAALREDANGTIASLERQVAKLEGVVAENQTRLTGVLGAIARLENPTAPIPTPAPPADTSRQKRV